MLTVVKSERAQEIETIFKEHGQLVFRTAYGVTRNREDAEDVVQAVFMQLVRQERRPEGKNLQGYLYRAAVNASLNTIRRRKRERVLQVSDDIEAPTRVDSINAELRHRRLYEAIAELKPDAAHIVILRYMHNKSDAEIAAMLGTSRGTIALKLFRSRARLRKLLRASLEEEL
jgi:RNA polymerase sigma factor (sigma-70 family)